MPNRTKLSARRPMMNPMENIKDKISLWWRIQVMKEISQGNLRCITTIDMSATPPAL